MRTTKNLSVRLPAPLHEEIMGRAEAGGVSAGEALRGMLREALDASDLDRRIEWALRRVLDEPEQPKNSAINIEEVQP